MEDSQSISNFLCLFLEKEFPTSLITVFISVKEIDQKIDDSITDWPDLILWDGDLTDGSTTNGSIEKARDKFPECIMISISANGEHVENSISQGCKFSLMKPFNKDQFKKVIAEVKESLR